MTNDPVLAGHSKLLHTGMPAERLELCAVLLVSFSWASILQLKLDLQEPREGTALHYSGTHIKSGSVLCGGLLMRHVMGKSDEEGEINGFDFCCGCVITM